MDAYKQPAIETAETETAIFQNLVLDAETHAHIRLSENLESYLVFLLLRFHKNAEGLYEPVALKYLNTANESGHMRSGNLRDTGDSCLILAGLFPGQARKRMVNISYFVRLGRSCYQSLAGCLKESHAELYNQLDHGFGSMLEILQTIYYFGNRQAESNPMFAYELWQETGSLQALETLKSRHGAIPVRNSQRYML